MRRAYVDIAEGQMHYRYSGKGEAIVLLHMSGSSSDEFDKVGDILKNRFSIFAPDILGFGGSDAPPRYYTLMDHAQSIIRFMDALQIDKAIFVGNLVGANIAARIAVRWPERVSGLLLSHLVYYQDYAQFKSARHRPNFELIELAQDGSHLLEYWKRSVQYGDPVEHVDARALCLHQAGKYGETLHWALFEDEDYNEILPQIKTPTVVVALEKMATTLAGQRLVAEMIPGAKYEMLKGVSPYVARTNPREFAQLISDYFA